MHITEQIKKTLTQLSTKPNKVLGQNFLINTDIYDKIISATDPQKNEIIVEVGSGLGTLTQYLADAGTHVIGIEKDRELIPYLQKKFASYDNVEIIHSDILKWNPNNLSPITNHHNYKIVGNIPYYLSSRLMRVIFESWPKPTNMVFMVQYEVAQKMTARPPKMTLLGVATQYYTQAKLVTKVSSGNFYPPPKVDSAIIKLIPKQENNKTKEYNELFFKLVTAGFHQKRKKLINNLSHVLPQNKDELDNILTLLNIDSGLRPEALTIETWEKLTTHMYSQ